MRVSVYTIAYVLRVGQLGIYICHIYIYPLLWWANYMVLCLEIGSMCTQDPTIRLLMQECECRIP